ncbi:ABC transporter ATP-binding protein [Anaerococcus hydrogenalis]|uniref:ABC transporter ATP-binding protein n=1 Tax=Anaerococcus hydrogenalis TaxID=33029 RepID=A0A2N6UJE8_9FIRM|nr:ABC transporter ATP-binding protein [Anaerococcus hydrogenalis]MDK7695237.1 ABC transporter ATP-binding protein [Anaerococcus hydrogenalis]MDK7696788.1 ABC transporter ATP-binding protein [Anaerococcus hydrogenalis]MDK7708264.1 ABC transporter ATP-binding protein [Anaerococcus hydrogenalis]PMC81792.1 ABC transporter ATP-binding protein [Anaerococcus hydrogenalis]
MFEAIKSVWNFSDKRQGSLVKILILSFIEGIFVMLKMIAIILAVNAMFNSNLMDNYIYKVMILGIVCIIGVFGFGYFTQLGSVSVGFEMAKDKRLYFGSLFKKLYLGFFSKNSVGNINSTLTTSISTVEQVAPIILIHVIGGILSAISIVLGFAYYEWQVAVVIFAGILTYLFVVNYQMKISRSEAPKRQLAQTKLTESAIEFIQGISVIKAFGMGEKDERVKKDIDGSCVNNINLSEKSIPSSIGAGLTIQLFEIMIISYAFFMWNSGEISPQKAINLLIMSFVIFQSVSQAGSILSMIGLLDSSLKDISSMENAEEIKVLSPIQNIKSNEIEFKNVSFSYGKGEVLKGISVALKPNTLTAIIGPSGSGKTTFCKLIPRFYDVSEGEILIGGAKITNISTEELMKNISMVFQNVYLFEDTIMNNIRLAKPNASDEDIISAAKKARCHDFIKSLQKGYETKIGEAGSTLSGGEKQRIAIARAILKDAPIVILDEFTSALDVENERHILQAIDNLVQNKTVIMIAHRLETVKKADNIIVLDKGEIAQEGTHNELITQDGIYKSFISIRERANKWSFK